MIGVVHHHQVLLGLMTDGRTMIGKAHRPRVNLERVVAARGRAASLMSLHHRLVMTGVNGNGMSIHRHPVANLARAVVARANQGRAIQNLLHQEMDQPGMEDGVS